MFDDCEFSGPLLTSGFVSSGLDPLLSRLRLYPGESDTTWSRFIRELREFASTGGPLRVLNHVLKPLASALGYSDVTATDPISIWGGPEDQGYLCGSRDGTLIRAWPLSTEFELGSTIGRGTVAQASPLRRAGRVLRFREERAALVTNGVCLGLLLNDPSGAESHIIVPFEGRSGWLSSASVPDSWRLFYALASPRGIGALELVFDAARLHQTSVTSTLRAQARAAIEGFLQCVLDHPGNASSRPAASDLWRQSLILIYRLLFVLKLESAGDPGGRFNFAASEAWRRGFSPARALGGLARRHLDLGHDTGRLLEDGLRILIRTCGNGLEHPALSIAPLGGRLFDPATTDGVDRLQWGERAVAILLDRLLWTTPRGRERERIHYGTLDVEELGRVYEALLDLEPDIARSDHIRTRRGRVESVLPVASAQYGSVTQIVATGQFFLRSGLGRRAGGSYYTPNEFVRFLVRETLQPLVRPSIEMANPGAILSIKVLDPAMGSGHFLVEACRFLADALYAACRACDAAASQEVRGRIDALPDPDRRLAAYLPSRSRDLADDGVSRTHAMAICRRLVAVHCLYGIDRDPMAVELAKLSLWLVSFADGLPLTFLDHRLVVGDSVAGPFFHDLSRLPVGGAELDPLLARGVRERLLGLSDQVLSEVRRLEASLGTNIADLESKNAAKKSADALLAPLLELTRAWSGAVASHARDANDTWMILARSVAETGRLPAVVDPRAQDLLDRGREALPLDLTFPEVFGSDPGQSGFHAVLGNPPWDVVHYQTREFLARFDPRIMDAPTRRERRVIEQQLMRDPQINREFERYRTAFMERKRLCDRMFAKSGSSGSIDMFQVFTERMLDCLDHEGSVGLIVPSSFHANEGTASLRRRLLDETQIEYCFTFENRKKLFDIHGRQKFCLLVARRSGPTRSFRCAFYLDALARLSDPDKIMIYDREFIAATGGGCEALLELRGKADFRLARHLFMGRSDMRTWMKTHHVRFGREAHMTDDSHRFTPIASLGDATALPLHEGKTFHRYTDRWKAPPRYAIHPEAIADKPDWLRASNHYRLAFREISRSTDERTMIAAIIPPGFLFGHKGTCEKAPWARPNATALILCAIFNSFTFDWCVRQKIAASVSLFMLNGCPAPLLSGDAARFLAHGALRLSCGHSGYDGLWHEQLGATEPARYSWELNDDRDLLLAAMDAAVARAYDLGPTEYRQVLAGFGHKADPDAPARCLAALEALIKDGETVFYRRYDPFHDVSLVESSRQAERDKSLFSAA
jgi:hypothetical protein